MSTVKVSLDGSIWRKIVINLNDQVWKDFSEKVKQIFNLNGEIVATYTDKEGDQITLDSNMELVDLLTENKNVKLIVSTGKEGSDFIMVGKDNKKIEEEKKLEQERLEQERLEQERLAAAEEARKQALEIQYQTILNQVTPTLHHLFTQLESCPKELLPRLMKEVEEKLNNSKWSISLFDSNQSCGEKSCQETSQDEKFWNKSPFGPHRCRGMRQIRHWGVGCDNCNAQAFIGPRYRCIQCPSSYDLCQQCFENKTHDENHEFEKVENPKNVWYNVICDGCDKSIFNNRFKCITCPDFDLCQTCMKKGHDHEMRQVLKSDFGEAMDKLKEMGFQDEFLNRVALKRGGGLEGAVAFLSRMV